MSGFMNWFTKGDWSVEKEGTRVYSSESGFVVAGVIFNEKDAHLIAAAPKMYELLKSWADSVDCVNDGYQYGLREETDELLVKARGEV